MNSLKEVDLLKNSFYSFHSFETDNVALISSVYPVGVIKNFLMEQFFTELESALKFFLSETTLYTPKITDLFSFRQTADLISMMGKMKEVDDSILNRSFSLLERASSIFSSDEFISTIEDITKTTLSRTRIDFSSQCYGEGDYLLAHDDRLDSRRVAFVLYFVDSSWSRDGDDGGSLEFVTTDHDGLSSSSTENHSLRQQYIPQRNEIAFFKVSTSSFHHVKEILSKKYRISLAGWLHDAASVCDDGCSCNTNGDCFNGVSGNLNSRSSSCSTTSDSDDLININKCNTYPLPCSMDFLYDSFKKIIPSSEVICKGQQEQFHFFHAEPSHPLYLEWLPSFWSPSFKIPFKQVGIPILKIYLKGDWLMEDDFSCCYDGFSGCSVCCLNGGGNDINTKNQNHSINTDINNKFRIVFNFEKKTVYSWKGSLQKGKVLDISDEFCTLTFPHDNEGL